jgi:predicted Zn-dependent protease
MSYRETFPSLSFAVKDAFETAQLKQQNYEVRTENGDPVYTVKAQELQHLEDIELWDEIDYMTHAESVIEALKLDETYNPESCYIVVWVP